MPRTEIPEYVNERPRPGQRHHSNTNKERRTIQLVVYSFGALCVIQAALNVSLRLTLHFSKSSAYRGCNTTHCGGNLTELDQCSGLNRNRECFENTITELTNMIQMREEERERLKIHLRELAACEPALRCPAGWSKINSRCYYLSIESNTWEESRRSCQSQGADLVVINSEQEQRAVYRLNGENVLLFWIGLRKVDGMFRWVDVSALTNEYWQPGEPNPADDEDCVESYHFRPELSNWNDVPCEKRQRWLCEKDPS